MSILKRYQLAILCLSFAFSFNADAASSNIQHPISGPHKHYLPMMEDNDLPARNAPIEFGAPLLGHGTIKPAIELNTGAILAPRLWIFGDIEAALQSFERPGAKENTSELAVRADFFANLQLSSTERFVIGITPLRTSTNSTRWIIQGDTPKTKPFDDAFNTDVDIFFFEGDLGEMFPKAQMRDFVGGDVGISAGRQPLQFQDGLFINSVIDAVAITQNSLSTKSIVNAQWVLYHGFNYIHRAEAFHDHTASIAGLHGAIDFSRNTIEWDIAYLFSRQENTEQHCNALSTDSFCRALGGDLMVGAISSAQQFGLWGVTLRLLGSYAAHETRQAGSGALLFIESNRHVGHGNNFIYLNAAFAFGRYSMLAQDVDVAGPLARAGLLFANTGVGTLGAPLSSSADHVIAATAGYQHFINDDWQLIFEMAGRLGTIDRITDEAGLMMRIQRGLGPRSVVRLDGFIAAREHKNNNYGASLGVLIKI